MEVKSGYKKTDIGVIPSDWKVKTLEEIASIDQESLGGATPGKFTFKYISLEDVNYGHLKSHSEQTFSTAPSRARRVIRNKDILLSTVRPNLKSHLLFKEKQGDWVCSTGFSTIRFRNNETLPEYVFQQLLFSYTEKQINNLLVGSNYPAINNRDVKRLAIPTPEHEEQCAIATALGDMDELLESLNSLITKKRAIKQATMQQLLSGKTRLSGHKEKWNTKQLGELSEIRSGGTPSTSDKSAWSGKIPWCTPTDITALNGKKYLSQTSRTITEHGLRTSSAELIPKNSIIMTTRATLGECAINLVPMTTNQGFKNLIPSNNIHTEFLYYLLSTQKQELARLASGSTFLEIGKEQLRQLTLYIPKSKEEQADISKAVSEIDKETEALNNYVEKMTSLKLAMMQELLTGRTRLI